MNSIAIGIYLPNNKISFCRKCYIRHAKIYLEVATADAF